MEPLVTLLSLDWSPTGNRLSHHSVYMRQFLSLYVSSFLSSFFPLLPSLLSHGLFLPSKQPPSTISWDKSSRLKTFTSEKTGSKDDWPRGLETYNWDREKGNLVGSQVWGPKTLYTGRGVPPVNVFFDDSEWLGSMILPWETGKVWTLMKTWIQVSIYHLSPVQTPYDREGDTQQPDFRLGTWDGNSD